MPIDPAIAGQKAEAVRLARRAYEQATRRLERAREEERAALTAQAQALDALKAAKRDLQTTAEEAT